MKTMEELRKFCDTHGIKIIADRIDFYSGASTKITFSIPNHCWNIILEDCMPEYAKVERMYEGIEKYILPYVQTTPYFMPNVKFDMRAERFVFDIIDKEYNMIDLKRIVDKSLTIDKVIFNNPATIVYWTDGTKTVVKCGDNDTFNEEVGIALAFMKKALGNKGNYNNVFRKHIVQEDK